MKTTRRRKQTTCNSSVRTLKAVSYLRTSSAGNVGTDKDSEHRQRNAIARFAKSAGYEIIEEFRDEAVSGKDPIDTRPGFRALLERVAANGVTVVIVESPDRFARHLLTQEAGIILLVGLGVRVLTSHGDDLTDSDDEFRVAMRQIMGVFSQLERTRLVKKLKHARERKRATGIKVEGRKALAELNPRALAMAKQLRRANPVTGERMSYRNIAERLAGAGHAAASGKPFSPSVVKRLLESRKVRSAY